MSAGAGLSKGQSGGPVFGFSSGDVGPCAVPADSWQTGSNNCASGRMDRRDRVARARVDFVCDLILRAAPELRAGRARRRPAQNRPAGWRCSAD